MNLNFLLFSHMTLPLSSKHIVHKVQELKPYRHELPPDSIFEFLSCLVNQNLGDREADRFETRRSSMACGSILKTPCGLIGGKEGSGTMNPEFLLQL